MIGYVCDNIIRPGKGRQSGRQENRWDNIWEWTGLLFIDSQSIAPDQDR